MHKHAQAAVTNTTITLSNN